MTAETVTETTTGAALLAQSMKQQGVDYMFGVVGFPITSFAAEAQRAGITYIGMRNEQAASYAAQAAGYLTGRPQACAVVSGPGVIHALAGLANAQSNRWPMILIGGASATFHNGMGGFQEERQVVVASPLSKYAHAVEEPERIPYYVEQAIRYALFGRPGAAYLDLPDDILTAEVPIDRVREAPTVGDPPRPGADPAAVARGDRGAEERRESAGDRGQGHGLVPCRARGTRLHREDAAPLPRDADGQGCGARRPPALGRGRAHLRARQR